MAAESIFKKSLEERAKDQETKKASNELEAEVEVEIEQIHLSLPADVKEKFLNHCKSNYISASAQLRLWIAQNCN